MILDRGRKHNQSCQVGKLKISTLQTQNQYFGPKSVFLQNWSYTCFHAGFLELDDFFPALLPPALSFVRIILMTRIVEEYYESLRTIRTSRKFQAIANNNRPLSTKLAASKTSIVIGRNDPPSLTPLQSVAYSSFPGQGGQTHFLPGFSISSR